MPSKFMLPIAIVVYIASASIFTNVVANIIVSDTLVSAGQRLFGSFKFTSFGLPLVVIMVVYNILFGKYFLLEYQPNKRPVDLSKTVPGTRYAI